MVMRTGRLVVQEAFHKAVQCISEPRDDLSDPFQPFGDETILGNEHDGELRKWGLHIFYKSSFNIVIC